MWDIEREVHTDDTNELRIRVIENLQEEIQQAGNVCRDLNSDNARLREEIDKLQEQCSKLLDKQYEDDYRLENMKKRMEYFVKKVEDFEKENKALRELVKLWS
jgi:peptidoglycan hydrolase CwlO-like protein